jgi:hypothetical protein
MATRTEVSRDRAELRDSRNVATFTQAMKKTAPEADARTAPMRRMPPATSGVMPV